MGWLMIVAGFILFFREAGRPHHVTDRAWVFGAAIALAILGGILA